MAAKASRARVKPAPAPDALVREQAGRYRSGDERFTVRQDGGEWFVTDLQQTNEFGLEMVLGPFSTVALAREAMAAQREHPAGAEPGAVIRPIVRARGAAPSTPPRPAREHRAAPDPAKRTSPAPKTREAPTKPAPPAEPMPPPLDYVPARWNSTNDERDQVARAVRSINDAWTSGHPEQMKDALDENVVFIQPGFAGRETGRDRAIESYGEFMNAATLRRYGESDLAIDLCGHTAVASYRWQIVYTMDGKDHDETGRDLFVLDRQGTRWKLVWRLLLPD